MERMFTREELSGYDGRDGGECFVAFEGTVYDVTDSVMWLEGDHEGGHRGGRDLTAEMSDAPHDGDCLADMPVMGVLAD